MKNASPAMISLLGSGQPMFRADLFSITLRTGTVLRYTSWDKSLTVGGNIFLPGPPNFTRGSITTKVGMEVSTMNMTVSARITDTVNGLPLLTFMLQKGFNDCVIKVETCFMPTAGDTSAGTIIDFMGIIGDCNDGGRSQATVQCKSLVALLQQQVPLRVLQPGCSYTLFDTGCTLSRAAFKVSNAVSATSTVNTITTTLAQADGYFDQGVIEFTSGANSGQKVCVRQYASHIVTMTAALPNAPQIGDTFDIYPGCDKTRATCQNKFSNLANFGGQPFVPQPQTVI